MHNARARLVADASDGPLMELGTRCNGLPDLVSSERLNLGEYDTRYWRYNGQRYQVVVAYNAVSAAEDSQGRSWPVVRDVDYRPIACDKAKP